MTDRKKVVKGLEKVWDAFNHMEHELYADYVFDALELLKEQPDIVRCEDCIHYKDGFCYNPNTFDDEKTCGNTTPDWYCADAERRETNGKE